ncbi:DNA methyltransferase [Nitrosomonas sp.]|uniref:DNA methyltransferase n=1 Tax=Nitrosomonas sp. TaxID=42353 RepID=UPI0025E3677E|nr:DNA methyltransferase [Nitrosomonas sp.]
MEQQRIGNATIMNVDCMEFMSTLPDKHFDLAVCDPPYFDGPQKPGYYAGSKQKTDVGSYKDISSSWTVPGKEYFEELVRISRNQIIWGINYYEFLAPGGRLIWIKGEQGSPFSMAEIAYQSFYLRVDIFKHLWAGFWQEPGHHKEKRIHPTQKPVPLYEWILVNYAKLGQKIFDSHMGSGSSAIAANNLGFEFFGCELDKDYYEVACKRVIEYSRQERLFA